MIDNDMLFFSSAEIPQRRSTENVGIGDALRRRHLRGPDDGAVYLNTSLTC